MSHHCADTGGVAEVHKTLLELQGKWAFQPNPKQFGQFKPDHSNSTWNEGIYT